MTPKELEQDAKEALAMGTNMTLVLPRPFKRPPKFPRGELLCTQETFNVYSYDPLKILTWLKNNNLIL